MSCRCRYFIFFLLLVVPRSGFADEYPSHGPISLVSQNPLYLLYLQPRPERARVLKAGQLRLSARGPYSNVFERQSNGSTGMMVDLDMEVFRPSFFLQWGFLPDWEFGLELPFINTNSGFLDGFIQEFHKIFGFPNSGRNLVPDGRFNYSISRNGKDLYRNNSVPFLPSDIVLNVKRVLWKESRAVPAIAGNFYLKIPTGNISRGTGSGMPDIGFNLAFEKNYKRIHGYVNLGGVILGPKDYGLDQFLNAQLWNWMVAVEITAWSHHLGVIAQLQGDGSLFHDTGLSDLDEGNLILTIGFGGQEGPWGWRAAFAEDPSGTGPAVDFTTYLEVSYTFN